jgi:hypothetical protein
VAVAQIGVINTSLLNRVIEFLLAFSTRDQGAGAYKAKEIVLASDPCFNY